MLLRRQSSTRGYTPTTREADAECGGHLNAVAIWANAGQVQRNAPSVVERSSRRARVQQHPRHLSMAAARCEHPARNPSPSGAAPSALEHRSSALDLGSDTLKPKHAASSSAGMWYMSFEKATESTSARTRERTFRHPSATPLPHPFSPFLVPT